MRESRNLTVKSFHFIIHLRGSSVALEGISEVEECKVPIFMERCHKLAELEPASVEPDAKK